MTRILMICPDTQMIDRRVLQSARSFVAAGAEVTLVSGIECAAEEHTELEGFELHRFAFDWIDPRIAFLQHVPRPFSRLVPLMQKVYRRWLQHLRRENIWDHFVLSSLRPFRADLVYVHDLPLLQYGRRLAREWGVPFVFDAHEIYYEQDTFPRKVRDRLRRREARDLPHAALFVTVNRFIADWYRTKYPTLECRVAHNSLPHFEAIPRDHARSSLLARSGFSEADTILLFQGWLSAERNLLNLVKAMRWVDECARLVVVGYGDHMVELERAASDLPHPERVAFLGRIESDELMKLTAGADLGVIPYLPIDLNHHLCSPNKFFEFVQNGVPVVAHSSPFFVEMAGRLGVVATGDLSSAESFAMTINSLLVDSGHRAALRAACEAHGHELAWERDYDTIVSDCLVLANRKPLDA